MKMKSLVDAVPALGKLSGQDMAVGDLHALHMLIEKATPHLNFYDEKRGDIISKYCSDEGGKTTPKPECVSALEEEMKALLDIDIEDVPTLSLPGDGIKLSYAEYISLGGIISFGGDRE